MIFIVMAIRKRGFYERKNEWYRRSKIESWYRWKPFQRITKPPGVRGREIPFPIPQEVTLWFWGENTNNYAGLNTTHGCSASAVTCSKQFPILYNLGLWRQVSMGNQNVMAIQDGNGLWGSGANNEGELGLGSFGSIYNEFQELDFGWKSVETGWRHSVGIDTDDKLYVWGYNSLGQLGLQDLAVGTSLATPRQHPNLPLSTTWIDADSAIHSSIGIQSDGTLWKWGFYGNVATGSTRPTQIGSDAGWLKVAHANYHSLALKTDGTLWSWTSYSFLVGNEYGQLGYGFTGSTTGMTVNTPVQIGTDTDWSFISAHHGVSYAIKTNGNLYSWGYNARGALGLGDLVDRYEPTLITGSTWSMVSAGGGIIGNQSVCAIKTDGTLWSWGDNVFNQLPFSGITYTNIPLQFGTSTRWIYVSVGDSYQMGTMALHRETDPSDDGYTNMYQP